MPSDIFVKPQIEEYAADDTIIWVMLAIFVFVLSEYIKCVAYRLKGQNNGSSRNNAKRVTLLKCHLIAALIQSVVVGAYFLISSGTSWELIKVPSPHTETNLTPLIYFKKVVYLADVLASNGLSCEKWFWKLSPKIDLDSCEAMFQCPSPTSVTWSLNVGQEIRLRTRYYPINTAVTSSKDINTNMTARQEIKHTSWLVYLRFQTTNRLQITPEESIISYQISDLIFIRNKSNNHATCGCFLVF